jgi:hypothetical protein
MERAEQAEDEGAREQAHRECADLILRVWSRRSGWPYGQPLAKVASTLKELAAEPDPYTRTLREPEESSWAGISPLLDELLDRERQLYRDITVASVPQDEPQSWLEEHEEDMSEEETDSLSSLMLMIERLSDERLGLIGMSLPRLSELPEKERHRLVLEALEELDVERQRLRQLVSPAEELNETEERVEPSTE